MVSWQQCNHTPVFMFFRLTRLSLCVTGALNLHVCGCVYVRSCSCRTRLPLSWKSCRDLPVFSFPLEAFPHTNKAHPTWWNEEEAAFVKGATDFYVCVCVCVCVLLTPANSLLHANLLLSLQFRLLQALVCWRVYCRTVVEQAYPVSLSENKVASCSPLINWYNTQPYCFYRAC